MSTMDAFYLECATKRLIISEEATQYYAVYEQVIDV